MNSATTWPIYPGYAESETGYLLARNSIIDCSSFILGGPFDLVSRVSKVGYGGLQHDF